MENLNRLNYDNGDVKNVESDVIMTVKQTLSQGLDGGGLLSFRFPADPERFTDLNSILLRVEMVAQTLDGTDVDVANHTVFLDQGGMHSCFASADVRFNDKIVSSMPAYPFTAMLSRLLGASREMRISVWDTLDGTWDSKSSKVDKDPKNTQSQVKALALSNVKVFIGRVYSDVLMSSRQFLPPGISLGIDLRRALDHFSLCSNTDETPFRLHMSSAALYVKRLRLRPSLMPIVERTLFSPLASIAYMKLDCQMMTVASGSSVFRWLDCLYGGPLPNRMYLAFSSQEAVFGKLSKVSTFFEPLNVKSVSFKLNGRELLVEPIAMSLKKKDDGEISSLESNVKMGYLSLLEVLNQVSDQLSPHRMSYEDYISGKVIYAVEFGKCGEFGKTSAGNLDVEVLFNEQKSDKEACALLFTESTKTALIN